ncbi:BrxA/BrxB family bacilliredoxin [Paenibacillus sp. KN14-4R]|uniref:BrxA/BrxB family bacilliredoxin n=1 Tax=Paenibacillus sp. KN14-4R TaxID=3445773 RepID=UPI003F9FC7FD
MSMSFDAYMKDMIRPMREDLTRAGVTELLTPEQVTEVMDNTKGTMLVVINSVCGCAAGLCRPGVVRALENEAKPEHLYTVFAGQEKEATAKLREYITTYPPSSPSIALFKDGELVHFIQRHQIEDRSAEMIAADLVGAFNEFCK